jgi:hypothetical protein
MAHPFSEPETNLDLPRGISDDGDPGGKADGAAMPSKEPRSGYGPTTLPRARPPGVRQEQPVPIGAGLIRAQVLSGVAQYPPIEDWMGEAKIGAGWAAAAPMATPVASPTAPQAQGSERR